MNTKTIFIAPILASLAACGPQPSGITDQIYTAGKGEPVPIVPIAALNAPEPCPRASEWGKTRNCGDRPDAAPERSTRPQARPETPSEPQKPDTPDKPVKCILPGKGC